MIRHITLLFVALFLATTASTQEQSPATSYEKEWKQIDSLMGKGLPKSAAEIAQRILTAAQQKADGANTIKAQLFLMGVDQGIYEHADIHHLYRIDSLIDHSEGPEKALWQSINAEMYWRYFQRNRWQLYNRTPVSGEAPADIATWDAGTFIHRIGQLYRASIADRTALREIPIAHYTPIIIKGENTRNLRPTLYDFLVFRAIDFFKNDEKDVIRPAYQFEIDGALWFEPAERFSEVQVKPVDADALHFQALRLFQEVIAFHLPDGQPNALIDADLQRLTFVHDYSVHPDKDSLYLAALQSLEKRYAGNPAVAEVSYRIVYELYRQRTPDAELTSQPRTTGGNTLPALKTRLEQIVAAYPETEGAAHAAQLLQQINRKELALQLEEVNIPHQHIKALVSYRNINSVYLTVYKVPADFETANIRNNQKQAYEQLRDFTPLKNWQQQLVGTADMETHRTEIKVDALPSGNYLLVAGVNPGLDTAGNLLHVTPFQVSNISLLTHNERERNRLYVLNRETGRPVDNAQVVYWRRQWDAKKEQYEYSRIADHKTDREGKTTLPNPDRNNRIDRITVDTPNDTLQTDAYFYGYSRGDTDSEKPKNHTFFFTDRAIYRPGQTIYFKGIVVQSGKQGRENRILPNHKTVVELYDANRQLVTSLPVQTNEFGSFEGKFTAPQTGLTGRMHLQEAHGSVYFSVEEYKRPRFQVEFDTLRGNYALNEQVQVEGLAKAYAGNTIDGAEVKYRVVRRTHFPYFWAFHRWGQPQSPEMEIANGTATTDGEGKFEIAFQTIPDRQINPETLPVFTYTIYADVTDLNGETRSGSQSLHAGYRSLQITGSIPEVITDTAQQLTVTTQNLNGVFTPAQLTLSVSSLQFPGKIYRQRLWEKPDQFVLSEAAFREAFPDDEYREESNYLNWETAPSSYDTTFTTSPNGQLTIPATAWHEEGWYVLELSGKDRQNNTITEKKYTYLTKPAGEGIPQQPIVAHANKTTYEPGDLLDLSVGAGFADAYILQSHTLSENQSPQLIAHNHRTRHTVTENDRGGIAYQWMYVHNNRVYTKAIHLSVPWSDRDLKLEWATHRDKLAPGEQEKWTLTVKGHQKNKVAAELLAGLYDASLDAFIPHHWHWNRLSPTNYLSTHWNTSYGFGSTNSRLWEDRLNDARTINYVKIYDRLYRVDGNAVYRIAGKAGGISAQRSEMAAAPPAVMEEAAMSADSSVSNYGDQANDSQQGATEESAIAPPVRTNFDETAFFLPRLQTNADGDVTFEFTMPEALTEWKMMAFAHTTDWKTGFLEGKVKTQKDLMVMPNLPRFLRQGDDISLSAKISNLGATGLQGVAQLELLDAETLTPINTLFGNSTLEQPFTVDIHQSAGVNWTLRIPDEHIEPVVIRITAKAGDFTDGEEHLLPVMTNRMLVTETLPLPVRGNEHKTFTLEKLLNPESSTLVNHALTVEFTGNPAWYAVQALPYLMESPHESAEQVFNRFYANALAAHIVAQSPKVKAIFDQWLESDTTALMSNLEKNQELKSALLEETPWVMEAKNEDEQKHRIALLFDNHKLAQGLQQNLAKLAEMQLEEGDFPWFQGMRGNRYITQYIVTGIARLQHLGVEAARSTSAVDILNKALPYLDRQLEQDHNALIEHKADLDKQHIGQIQIQYLYMRSYFADHTVRQESREAFSYYQQQAAQYWNTFNPYLKGHIALALHRNAVGKVPQDILASLAETAIQHEELGMYWKTMPRGYWWYEAPIEAQALLIEAFAEIGADTNAIDALNVWLLKQKQTQHWHTTKATADAVYALLLQGSDWLVNEPAVTISLGNKTIRSEETRVEAGTGYFKERFEGDAVTADMGNISVQVNHAANAGVSWGAVYWQYFEDLDQITSAETPLSLNKKLYIERHTDRGPVLAEVSAGHTLNVGDKVIVRIELRADRDMEYVHLKDMRAAGFEPINVLSGYRYQGGLGYYENTRDVSTNFFFDYLRQGTYVFEYPLFVSQAGNFSNGIATIQCMYAPEFASHSEGIRITVSDSR